MKWTVFTQVVLQQPFVLVVWSSSTALTNENQSHVLPTNIFWQCHNSQYTLQSYSMTEWDSRVMSQHRIERFLAQMQPH